MQKQVDIVGSVFLIVMMFPTLIFGSAYVTQIQTLPTTDATTSLIIGFIPLLLALVQLIFAVLLIYKATQ